MSTQQYTKDDCIEALKEAAEFANVSLTAKDYRRIKQENDKDDWPSTYPIRRTNWDTWVKALEAAGLDEYAVGKGGNTPISRQPTILNYTDDEWRNLSSLERHSKRRSSKVWRIKLEVGCNRCGYNEHPAALSFHHINPEDKLFNLSQVKNHRLDKVYDEIKKCEILCENCHRVESTPMEFI